MTPLLSQTPIASAASGVRFEDLADSVSRLPGLFQAIPDIVRQPSANPLQALVLLAIVLLLIVVLLLSVILVVTRPRRAGTAEREAAPASSRVKRARAPLGLSSASLVILVAAAMWVAFGVGSSFRPACASCHDDSPHTTAKNDPHRSVDCVDCHEPGGWTSRVTASAASRLEHIVTAALDASATTAYGRVISSDSCRSCHASSLARVKAGKADPVRMSHAEPLEAGAECVDCHVLRDGAVSGYTVGMSTCVPCHTASSKAGSACETCHVGDPARAVRAREARPKPKVLVAEPRCDGCHASQEKCDACHGMRMPHSRAFMAYEHARAAAIDIWDNGGRLCKRCHTAEKRPCTRCHSGTFPSHPLDFKAGHQSAAWGSTCGCHEWDARKNRRLFCEICHAKRPATARF